MTTMYLVLSQNMYIHIAHIHIYMEIFSHFTYVFFICLANIPKTRQGGVGWAVCVLRPNVSTSSHHSSVCVMSQVFLHSDTYKSLPIYTTCNQKTFTSQISLLCLHMYSLPLSCFSSAIFHHVHCSIQGMTAHCFA